MNRKTEIKRLTIAIALLLIVILLRTLEYFEILKLPYFISFVLSCLSAFYIVLANRAKAWRE